MSRTVLFLSLALIACTGDDGDDTGTTGVFTLSSPDFEDGGDMPTAFKCSRDGGGDQSPSVTFSNVPADADSLALTMHFYPGGADGDGPPNHYWLLWDLDPSLSGIAAGNPDSLGTEGSNKDGVETGYTPPCSPSADETHEYILTLHAVQGDPGLPANDDLSMDYLGLLDALDGYVIDTASMTVVN